jgi:zinc transport system substrate-binding protein
MSRGVVASVVALLLLLTGCDGIAHDPRPQVVAAFYPLQFVAERVVGEHASVTGLTQPGVEPHDLELTVRQVARLSAADVGLYEKGLQPAVDRAMTINGPRHRVDVTDVVELRVDAAAEHTIEGTDPHFWQDPTLLARVATAFTRTMARVDPEHAEDYRRNDARLQSDLAALDAAYRSGTADCRTRTLVVSHDAFEYLGRRYGFHIVAIAGLSPDAEPSARHLAALADLVRTDGVTTVFSERLASPALARTLAGDVGVRTAVLDPVEGLASGDHHDDYLTLMRANLAKIRKANSCR